MTEHSTHETFFGRDITFADVVYDALVIGSGAAGYNAAVNLYDRGARNIAIITENRLAGASRNTGSDKQTYYKVACSGADDSCRKMAATLFSGGSMDGDIALCEAAHSLEAFFHLTAAGVAFPHNRYGEFAGYQTDHDPARRASSTGPYTSRLMTERLEAEAQRREIAVINHTQAVKLLVDRSANRAYGLLCLENRERFAVYFAKNIVFATGGPAGIYRDTVYPPSQFGASGLLVREGAAFANVTEWQYGIGSTGFRWNLSGSYQQVMPRYVSIDPEGGEREFLWDYFSGAESLSRAVFLKGYQWPFSPERMADEGSSLIDSAVYIERHIRGRRVYLDFTKNHRLFDISKIDPAAREYLGRSNALGDTPFERLLRLNPAAYQLYQSHNIDLAKDYLEIDVLPQHHNGGAMVNIWWETSIGHLFAIGECAGTHGVKRPGGSALNAGQVGGIRAAKYIAASLDSDRYFENGGAAERALAAIRQFETELVSSGGIEPVNALRRLREINSSCAAFLRSLDTVERGIAAIGEIEPAAGGGDIGALLRFDETRLFSLLLLHSIAFYIQQGGRSRGSCLILAKPVDSGSIETELQQAPEIDQRFSGSVLVSRYDPLAARFEQSFRPVRPIPDGEMWFETVWHEYSSGTIFNKE